MAYKDGYFKFGRIKSYYRVWLKDEPSDIVIIVHGIGEHLARYENFAEKLMDNGFGVASFDLIGHGRSRGIRGHVSRFDDYLEQLSEFIKFIRSQYGKRGLFLIGHSLGGLIALNFVLKNPEIFQGVVLSSPALALRIKPTWFELNMARAFSRILPFYTQNNRINTKFLSHDRSVVLAYDADTLCHHKISARLYTEMVGAMKYAGDNMRGISIPILILQAGSDKIVNPETSSAAFQTIVSRDKDLHIYPGLFHEIFNEIDNAQVIDDLLSWLKKRRNNATA
ncbi:MAG: hypothetical protein AUJ75_04120 [Candidatus Omnitrophica bacterium CG1_02_49_10]|nr:MAG: hypothetical protein AUJ75_04120 [Candidatus Omnitrophica bacterium CG1_02_49_10]